MTKSKILESLYFAVLIDNVLLGKMEEIDAIIEYEMWKESIDTKKMNREEAYNFFMTLNNDIEINCSFS